MERTPHPEEPAEGALGAGDPDDERHGTTGPHDGDPAHIPAHNTAPDGYAPEADDLDGNSQGAAQGGAIQGDSSHGESPRGAIQGSADDDRDAPLGGDRNTAEQLESDNEVEDDTLRSLDPDNPPA